MADNEEQSARGPVPPYGPAIWDAAKRGDLHEMEHIAEAARLALARGAQQEGLQIESTASKAYGHFHDVAAHEVAGVREALTHLEGKIHELRQGQRNPQDYAERPPAAPREDPEAQKAQAAQPPPGTEQPPQGQTPQQ
jgi:Domain of unknown function (DUF1843)